MEIDMSANLKSYPAFYAVDIREKESPDSRLPQQPYTARLLIPPKDIAADTIPKGCQRVTSKISSELQRLATTENQDLTYSVANMKNLCIDMLDGTFSRSQIQKYINSQLPDASKQCIHTSNPVPSPLARNVQDFTAKYQVQGSAGPKFVSKSR